MESEPDHPEENPYKVIKLRNLLSPESIEIKRIGKPPQTPGIRERTMEAVASRVDALIEKRKSLLITVAELHADLVESGAYERFNLVASSRPLTALGDVMGGHGFKVPQIRRSWCRYYVLPCVKMTEAEKEELRMLSTKELTNKVHEMHLMRFDPAACLVGEKPAVGPYLAPPDQIIETIRAKLPEIISLVGDVFVSPWDLHQLDLAHQTLGGGSCSDPGSVDADGDISESEEEIREAFLSLDPSLPTIWTDYGAHYFLPGLMMDTATQAAYMEMAAPARFRVVLAAKRALIALPGKEARDPSIVLGNHFWEDVLKSSGVLNQWFEQSYEEDEGDFNAAISKAFWLERRLHRTGFQGWHIVASEVEPKEGFTVSDVVAELDARFAAEFEPAGFTASGPAVKEGQ